MGADSDLPAALPAAPTVLCSRSMDSRPAPQQETEEKPEQLSGSQSGEVGGE